MAVRRLRFIPLIAALLLASTRWAAAACVPDPIVTNNFNSGPGSLRDAIDPAKVCAGSTITFAPTVARPITITLEGTLVIDQSLTIQGPGANLLIISGQKKWRVFQVGGGTREKVDVTLSGLTIADGHAPNGDLHGGGIKLITSSLTIYNSTLSGNSVSGNTQAFGGAIFNWSGTLNVINSTLLGNSAESSSPGNTGGGSLGGAILNYLNGTVNVINSTLTRNTVNAVAGAGSGGAIYNYPTATLNLTNSTVFGNSVTSTGHSQGSVGGGITSGPPENRVPGVVNVRNTIIAGNTVTADGSSRRLGPDVAGEFASQGYNLIGKSDGSYRKDGTPGTPAFTKDDHDQVGSIAAPLNPMLDANGLRSNGGPTQTVALLAGSPAIDHGSAAHDPADSATGSLITTDQRGFLRPVDDPNTADAAGGNGSDIGAFEYLSRQAACVLPPNTTMVAWYPFDESTGTQSANLATGNTGAHVDGPTPISGMVAGALRFDGVGSYVESPSSIVTNIGPASFAASCSGSYSSCLGNFSIDTWVRVDPSGSGVLTILDKRIDTPVKGYAFFVFEEALGLQLADDIGSGYSNYFSPVLTPSLTDGNWHHIAVTVRRTRHAGLRWYHNGALVGIGDPTDRLGSLVNDSPLRIGTRTAASPLSGWFAGDLDELEIFNRVLTPQEVASIFNAGAQGKCR
jgi:hypothetical protein